MKTLLKITTVFLLAIFIASCSSASIVSSFADPTAKSIIQNSKKIFVASLMGTDAMSRNAEQAISQEFGARAVPAYQVMDNLTQDNADQYLKANNFDLAVVSRLVKVDKSLDYVPGDYNSFPDYYGGFYGYWGMAYSDYNTPGYYETTKTYRVETNIYDLKTGKLIYSAITDSYEPNSFSSGMSDVIAAIEKDMKKSGVIN